MKCKPIENKWCEAIKMVADFGNPDATGLAVSRVMNLKTGTLGHGLKYGFSRNLKKELGGSFIWVEYCPFCGANVSKRTKGSKG